MFSKLSVIQIMDVKLTTSISYLVVMVNDVLKRFKKCYFHPLLGWFNAIGCCHCICESVRAMDMHHVYSGKLAALHQIREKEA